MRKKPIPVLIIDDHAIVREGLKRILADTDDIVVAGEGENGLEAIRLAREGNGKVMLLDITMPDRNGIDVLKQIHREVPQLAVLILTMHREDQYAVRSMKAGAVGYLNKQSASTELVKAIREVSAGRKYISTELAQILAAHITEDTQRAPHETLSDREFQTLLLIASGKSVTDIAAELALSVKTVSEYRSRILSKMGMKNNSELMHYAITHKLGE
ncbi:MAG: response regulator transcription factor [Burkholderiaceae bacterium]|jgi:DNA-binding NarL/FixJ family response regulator|nr:response regulator transcription factor [Burkholderiaceae bacterium]